MKAMFLVVIIVVVAKLSSQLVQGGTYLMGPTVKTNQALGNMSGPLSTEARTVIITETTFPGDAVVYAFIAVFKSDDDMAFQIYRPTSAVFHFTLVYQYNYKPEILNKRIVVRLSGYLCFRTRVGDRLAILTRGATVTVAYKLSGGGEQVHHRSHNSSIETLPRLREYYEFAFLNQPYEFQLAAMVDLDMSRYRLGYNQHCQSDLPIPDDN